MLVGLSNPIGDTRLLSHVPLVCSGGVVVLCHGRSRWGGRVDGSRGLSSSGGTEQETRHRKGNGWACGDPGAKWKIESGCLPDGSDAKFQHPPDVDMLVTQLGRSSHRRLDEPHDPALHVCFKNENSLTPDLAHETSSLFLSLVTRPLTVSALGRHLPLPNVTTIPAIL